MKPQNLGGRKEKEEKNTKIYALTLKPITAKTICNDNRLDNLSVYGGLTEHYLKELKHKLYTQLKLVHIHIQTPKYIDNLHRRFFRNF
jgi:hypothetical protein